MDSGTTFSPYSSRHNTTQYKIGNVEWCCVKWCDALKYSIVEYITE